MAEQHKIRVVVVDDSALMRKRLSEMIDADPACEVIATARNGEEALRVVAALHPQVVTLDLAMPTMDGMTTLKYLMSEWPTPTVMVSGYTHYQGLDAIKCLEYGAVDLVTKPNGAISLELARIHEELLTKIKAAANVSVRMLRPRVREPRMMPKKARGVDFPTRIAAIASSTGGPQALVEVLPKLPADLSAAVVVIQHMPAGFTDSMAQRLNVESFIRVKEAEDGELLIQRTAYIAPGGFQLTVASGPRGVTVKLMRGSKTRGVCPSADVTMKSLAPLFGAQGMGVILTGMGADGVEGLRAIKRHGGYTIAQNRATSVIYGMPRAAVEAGVVDRVVPLDHIAAEITQWAQHEQHALSRGSG